MWEDKTVDYISRTASFEDVLRPGCGRLSQDVNRIYVFDCDVITDYYRKFLCQTPLNKPNKHQHVHKNDTVNSWGMSVYQSSSQ